MAALFLRLNLRFFQWSFWQYTNAHRDVRIHAKAKLPKWSTAEDYRLYRQDVRLFDEALASIRRRYQAVDRLLKRAG